MWKKKVNRDLILKSLATAAQLDYETYKACRRRYINAFSISDQGNIITIGDTTKMMDDIKLSHRNHENSFNRLQRFKVLLETNASDESILSFLDGEQ